MKSIKKLLYFSLIFSVLLTGCETKKAYESENTQDSVQVDNNKDVDQILEIDEDSALQLVLERLDTTIYSAKKDKEITQEGANYYVFQIVKGEEVLPMGIAVNKVSGELHAFKEDQTVAPYSEFTLYDESKDEVVSWEGTFKEGENATLELMPADANSFEFTLTNVQEDYSISGVAQASGKEATYDVDGYQITFLNEGESILLSENGTNEGGIEFKGTYTK